MPMHFLVVDDDLQFAPVKAVKALIGFYDNANTSLSITTPEERHDSFFGHFGFFRTPAKDTLWPKATAWFEKHDSVNTEIKTRKS